VGTRCTVTDLAEGNGRPVEHAEEEWYSPELQVIVMKARRDSSTTGTIEYVTRLTNFVRKEPPAELFQIPWDYTLVEDFSQPSVK
jgi:hypothetical protein